jgi:hypothetical protein
MKARLVIALALAALVLYGHDRVRAQTGQIVFLGATAGTTLAANCPATPTTPSICVVGAGVYVWQTAAQGWFLLAPPTATAGVTSWNGLTGAVTYTAPTAPVTSVNGKTGAVTLAATSPAPIITLQ